MSIEADLGRGLYPFLYDSPRALTASADLLAAVRRSTLDKCADVVSLRDEMLAEYEAPLAAAATAIAGRLARGGKIIAFGNGGSATDADDAALDCMTPPLAGWRALAAVALSSDAATISAVANDVGIEHVFVRQLAALAEPGDVALAFSTSGRAPNVVAGLAAARRRGLLTIAFAGYDGGAAAVDGAVDFCFVARREYVPRIQEGHATLWHALLRLVQQAPARPSEIATRPREVVA